MIYSPVIIPTMCRYEQFRNCLESLNANHNADKTEVYVSVDYPVNEKQLDGHDKICDYLDHTSFSFKKIYVFKQTENLGIGRRPDISNFSFLWKMVREKYDRWIFTEDDNFFAPNYLDFMNQGLERFKDDQSVYAIGGYRFFYNLRFKDNNFFRQQIDFNAWGYGIWRDRWDRMLTIDYTYLKRIVFSPLKTFKVWKKSNLRMGQLIYLSYKKNFKKGDNFFSLYMINEDMYQVMPAISKVRNTGWDNSGLHCNDFSEDVVKAHLSQYIDDNICFNTLVGDGWEFFKENERIVVKEDFQQMSLCKVIIKYIIRILHFWK